MNKPQRAEPGSDFAAEALYLSLPWFAGKTRPIFNGSAAPYFGVQDYPRPATCPEPLCLIEALPLLHRSYGLMRQTKTLPSYSAFIIRRVRAGCCRSLLGDGLSRRYLCNPSIGAWTHTPGCLSGALVRFFPESSSLTLVAPSSAHPQLAAMQLQRRGMPYNRLGTRLNPVLLFAKQT